METPLRISARQLEILARAQHRRQIVESFSQLGLVVSPTEDDHAFSLTDAEGRSARLSFGQDGAVRTESAEGRAITHWFDANGELVRLVDPGGLEVTTTTDPASGTVRIVREGFGAFELQHDSSGRLVRVRYPDDSAVRFVHTPAAVTVFDQAGAVTRSELGPSGEATAFIDRNGHRTEIEWPQGGAAETRPLRITLPDRTLHEYLLGPTGTLERWSVNGDVAGRYSGDMEGFPTRYEFSDGHWVRLREDEDQARLVAETPTSRLVLDYDASGLLASEDQDGLTVRYERDRTGLLTAIVLPDGERLGFAYDGDGRLAEVRDWAGELTRIAWAPHGQIARVDHPNGVSTEVSSNKVGLPRHIATTVAAGAPLFRCDYAYDALDRISSMADGAAERRFTYDPIGRLTSVASDDAHRAETWSLDAMGNRLTDGPTSFTADAMNRISGDGDRAIAYDVFGRTVSVTTPRGRARLSYNGQSQLIRAELADGTVAEYGYDALGRRIRKTVNGAVTRYLWAGQSLLREWREDSEGGWRRRDHLVLPGFFLPLAMRVDGRIYRQHTDHRCAPLALTDAGGKVVWRADYKAFGEALITTAEVANPWRLANQYEDDETGLHYNLARYYHPWLGRYLTPDPAFDPANGGNLYLYAAGDPVNGIDPTGEIIPLIIAGAVIGAAIAGGIKAYQVRNEPGTFGQKAAKVAMAAGVGAVVGAVGAAVGAAAGAAVGLGKVAGAAIGTVMAKSAAVGAVSAAAEACAESALLEGRPPTAKEVLLSAAVGGGIGAVTAGIGGVIAARAARKAAREAAKKAAREAAEKAESAALKRGAERAVKHGAGWPEASLDDTIKKVAGPNPAIIKQPGSSKTIFRNPETGKEVIYDRGGDYFRARDPNLPGKRQYLDAEGNPVPSNKTEMRPDGKTRAVGKSQAEYNKETHFRNKN